MRKPTRPAKQGLWVALKPCAANYAPLSPVGFLARAAEIYPQRVAVIHSEAWGETPCAFVQLKPGARATEEEIIAHCRSSLARFKVPKKVLFGELPTTATGKIQKYVLRERARELS